MSHKTIARWAIVIIIAFVATIVVYPLLYNPIESTVPAQDPMPSLETPAPPAAE